MNQFKEVAKTFFSSIFNANPREYEESQDSSSSSEAELCNSDCSECLKCDRKENTKRIISQLVNDDSAEIVQELSELNLDPSLNDTSINLDNYQQKAKRFKPNPSNEDTIQDNFDLEKVIIKVDNEIFKERESYLASLNNSKLSALDRSVKGPVNPSAGDLSLIRELNNQGRGSGVRPDKKRKFNEISNSAAVAQTILKIQTEEFKQAPLSQKETQSQERMLKFNPYYHSLHSLATQHPVFKSNEGPKVVFHITLSDLLSTLSESKLETITTEISEPFRAESDDRRKGSVLSKHGISTNMIQIILKEAAKGQGGHPGDIDTSVAARSTLCGYQLTKRAISQLRSCEPLTDEVLNAYMRLVSSKRSTEQDSPQFHFFDSLFCSKLEHLLQTNRYTFLEFTSYFDKGHYYSPPSVTNNSVLVFLLNNEHFDYALAVANVSAKKIVIFDSQEGRSKETFALKIKGLKRFIGDYIACFPSEETGVSEDDVNQWKVEQGLCAKMDSQAQERFGSGIYMIKYIDYLTQRKAPCFDVDQGCTIEDLYTMTSLELLTSKLLNYI